MNVPVSFPFINSLLGRRVSYVKLPMTKYVFGPSGYEALWAHFGVIWWVCVLAEVRVRDWYCVMRTLNVERSALGFQIATEKV